MITVGSKVIVKPGNAPKRHWGRVGIVKRICNAPVGVQVSFNGGTRQFFYLNEVALFEEQKSTYDPKKEFNDCIRCGTSTANTIKNFSGITHAVCCECKTSYIGNQYRKVSE